MADLNIPINASNPQALLQLLQSMNNFTSQVQSRLSDINGILYPTPPPIEPQLRVQLAGSLRTLRDSAAQINQIATQTLGAVSLPTDGG